MEPKASIVDGAAEVQDEVELRKTHAFEGVITAVEPHQGASMGGGVGYNPVLRHDEKCYRCGRPRNDSIHNVSGEDADAWKIPEG